jgi:NTE family protein
VTPTAKPNTFFLMQVVSILNVLDVQLRSLRVSQITEAFATGQKQGAYISLRSKIGEYGPGDHLSVDQARAIELSHVPGRLAKMDSALQERLINWGYAICDAAVRKQPGARHGIAAPQFPYAGGV